jgi:hypothetical protein
MHKTVLMFSPQNNQVQTRQNTTEHNITQHNTTQHTCHPSCSSKIRGSSKMFLVLTFLMQPVLITTVTVTFILLFKYYCQLILLFLNGLHLSHHRCIIETGLLQCLS